MGATTNVMRWLETVALGFFVYELTGSPFWVAFVGLVRMLPMFVLGAFVGVIADRFDRRLLLMGAMGALAVTYAALAVLAITGLINLWHVLAGAFVAGMVWVTDFPVRRAMIAEVVQPQRVTTAMGLEMATSNFSRMLGPLAAGGFLATVGIQGAYIAGVVLFVFAFLMSATPQLPRACHRPQRGATSPELDRRHPVHSFRRRGGDDAGDYGGHERICVSVQPHGAGNR